jgi:hypothetical protein
MPPPANTKDTSVVATAQEKLRSEELDRSLGRLSVEQRQQLAYLWADRAVRVHAATLLEQVGLAKLAAPLKAASECKDEAGCRALRDTAQRVWDEVEKLRLAEERNIPEGSDNAGPGGRGASAMSRAVEAAKAALGEAGLKVKVTAGSQGPQQVKKEAVDVNVSRAILAAKHGANIAGLMSADGVAQEEARQRQDIKEKGKIRVRMEI